MSDPKTRGSSRTPQWLIERLALGELDAKTAEAVRQRLRAEGLDPEATLTELAQSNREILSRLPAARVATEIRSRAAAQSARAERAPRRRMWFWATPTLALGMAAIVLGATFALRTSGRNTFDVTTPSAPEADGTRIKGLAPASLALYRRRGDGHERLQTGTSAARGDLLQLAYVSAGHGFGVIVSVDGARHVTVHYPSGATGTNDGQAAPLETGAEVRLPSAYELDDAPIFERFFLIKSTRPFPVATAIAAARTLAERADSTEEPLPLPDGLFQTSISIRKTPKDPR